MTRILVAASAVVLGAFAAFSYYINSVERSTATAAIEANISSSGEQAANSLANWMNGRVTLTAMVANAIGRTADQPGVKGVLQNDVLRSQFVSTYLGDEKGVFTSWPDLPLPADYDPRKRPWYQDAVKANAPVLTEPYNDASSGDLIISAAIPVKRDGKLAGVVGSDFSLETMVDMIKEIDLTVCVVCRGVVNSIVGSAVNTMDQGTQQNAAMVEEQTAPSHGLAAADDD